MEARGIGGFARVQTGGKIIPEIRAGFQRGGEIHPFLDIPCSEITIQC
jgi:hypothetical protein